MNPNPKMQKDESVFDRMASMMIAKLGMGRKKSKPDRSKNAGSNNHSKKSNKKRRKMAQASRSGT